MIRFALSLLVAFTVACSKGDDTTDELPPCPAAGTVTTLATGFADGTEGVTFGDDGTLYVSAKDRVVTIAADGTVTDLAMVPEVVGLTWWNGAVWAAAWENTEGKPEAALYEITPDGQATRTRIGNPERPNFLLPTPWGTLLVADSTVGTPIYEFNGNGVTTLWAEGLASPNGMGFSPDGSTLFVANTFANPAPLSAIPVTDGVAGTPETVYEWGTGTTPDGLVVADDGSVLVALNLAGRIDAWDGANVTQVATNVPDVASLAFGRGAFDSCSVIATSLFGDSVYEVSVGRREPGAQK
jgi:sugar lactone lactonase YvrE